jgi:peptide chain release factor subunit 1
MMGVMRTLLLDAELQALTDRPLLPADTFLSVYLDASVNAQGKRDLDPFLDKSIKTTRQLVARLPVDLRGYDALAERIHAFATGTDFDGVKGLAVFAELPPSGGAPSGGEPFSQFLRLPVPVENCFVLGREPDLGPLLRAIATYDHYLVARFDADDARILSVYLARVVGAEADRAEGPAEEVLGRIRSKPGGWSQMRYQHRKREHVQNWFRNLAHHLVRMVERERPAGIVLLGQDVNLAAFQEELPEALKARVIGVDTIEAHASDAEIVARVEPLVEGIRGSEGAKLADEVYDRVRRDFFAVGGIDDTLAALQEGKVETLVVSRKFDARGGRCESCRFLVSAEHQTCSYCGGRLAGVPLLQHLVRKAREQEAKVRFVAERDSRLDAELEGVGALLRF